LQLCKMILRNRYLILWMSLLSFGLFHTGCQPDLPAEHEDTLTIVCTTGMLGDAVRNIVPDSFTVHTLMGPGVDPHLYKAAQGDLQWLNRADLIFYNGLHLEGKMGEVLEKVARQKKVVAVGETLDTSLLINSTDYPGTFDPHIWFDVALWSTSVEAIAEELATFDPDRAAEYRSRAATYVTSLQALDQEVQQEIQKIPSSGRVLITAHDAFEYFGKAYDIEVRGLQGISTVSEYGLRDVTDLVSFIVNRGVKAIFVESSVPTKSLEAVVEGCRKEGHEVKIGGTLFSDAMGADGTPEGTYPGMVRYNLETIVSALR
jgi:manganese/zinc/iron transport system substrate-binding protein